MYEVLPMNFPTNWHHDINSILDIVEHVDQNSRNNKYTTDL